MVTREQLTPEEMDRNTMEAEDILISLTEKTEVTVFDVARWWKEHYMRCGHRRLGRVMLKFAGILQGGE